MLQLAVAGRTMQNRCITYVPSVYFCGIVYAYRKRAFIESLKKLLAGISKIVPNYKQKNTFLKL